MRGIAKDVRAMVFRLGLSNLPADELEKISTRITDLISQYEEAETEYNALSFIAGEKELYDAQKINWDRWVVSVQSALSSRLKQTPEGMSDYVAKLAGEFRENTNTYLQSINDLVSFHQEQARFSRERAEKSEILGTYTSIGLICFGFLFSMIVGFLFGRNLSRTLLIMSEKLQNGSLNMNRAAATVATMSQDLASGAQEQAGAIQQTSAAMVEISSTVSRSAENAAHSQKSAHDSQQNVENGKGAIESLLSGLDLLQGSNKNLFALVGDNTQKMDSLVQIIKEIESKTKVINDIVFQTKLLSFNASVEAARAGEAGKGFSVVAEEVGKLAQMSGTAAKEISTMLLQSIERVSQIATESKTTTNSLTSEANQRFAAIMERVKACQDTFGRIYSGNVEVVRGMEQICDASKEQDLGMQEISKAISSLETTTQASAATSDKASEAASDLAREVDELKLVIQELQTTVKGGGAKSDFVSAAENRKKNDNFALSKGKEVLPFRDAA